MNVLKAMFSQLPRATPQEAAGRVEAGTAILVDVRELHETSRGMLAKARLLPLNDLNGARDLWGSFLAQVGEREIIVYCASGVRSCVAGRLLASEGFRVSNGGCLTDWTNAGWAMNEERRAKE